MPPAVPILSIETTNVCNSDCVFCPNIRMKRPRQALSDELFRKAIDEHIALGGTEVDFNAVIGEPLLDPKLLERARYVRKHAQVRSLGFTTTLQWLHRFPIGEFFAVGFDWLSISTVLSGAQRYREFFGVDLYGTMLNNLETLLRENQSAGRPIRIHIGLKPTPDPLESVLQHPDYRRIRELYGPDLDRHVQGEESLYVDDWGGAVALPDHLSRRPLIPRNHRPCRLLYKGPVIFSNGSVGACSCRDFEAQGELILGHIGRDSLADLWNGTRISEIRSGWLKENRIPELCRGCRHYLYY